MKRQDKAMARDLNEIDISSMPGGQFKVTVIKILTGLEKRVKNISETLTTEIKEFKKKESMRDEECN